MEEQENKRGFRVNDRRRFSPDTGEAREESAAPATAAEEEKTSSFFNENPEPRAQRETAAKSSAQATEISFSSFILGLSTQALMYMGEMPSAPGYPTQTDFAAAQQMIDVLAMLQKKTTGNLDTGEAQMLEHALFDLRMRYVELVKKGRPETAKPES